MRLQIVYASFVLVGIAAFARAEQGGAAPPVALPAPSDAAPGDYRPDDAVPAGQPASVPASSAGQAPEGQASGGQANGADAEKPASPSTGDTWRFRWHNGQWWYWQPSNRWVVWNNGRWIPYEPGQAAPAPVAAPRRAQSYSGATQGPWGPIRYDGYGNRQYPYSRRNSGLKQLGPVPAMGGVRSLPGWGGER